MLAIYPILVLNRFCKFEFVTSSNERNGKNSTKPIVGCVLSVTSTNLFLPEYSLVTCHQNAAPVWAFSISTCRTPYDNKHNAGGVEEQARREVNYYHSLVALVQRLQKIKFSECFHSLIGECTPQGELV